MRLQVQQPTLFFTKFPKPQTCYFTTMAAMPNSSSEADSTTNPNSQNDLQNLQNYPVPLSPRPPLISKDIELSRAMSAKSNSFFRLPRPDVIYQDQWFVVVNKPQGWYCERVFESVPMALCECDSAESGSPPELHLANRLDRDTSGVMLITKSHKVASKMVKAFTDHKVTKTYIALCIGPAPKWEKITVKSGHGRSKFGAYRVYAASDVGRVLPGGSMVKDMETSFEVLSINGQGCFKERSEFRKDEENTVVVEEKAVTDSDVKRDEVVVRAYPRNGRTHQIRLHCQYLGIPIIGDVKYEGVKEWKGRSYDGHELHAESLSFEHPVTGLPVTFCAPLPLWASQALQQ
ncbi:RNA pseudouridine synthase 1 [Castanea sativa]|uniref:RNA pseudouridine synthase 1 n=1 Tax=Castanea sativa TaxID=21020 RepID=UPI003F64E26B